MASSDEDDTARLAATVTRLERSIEELTVAIARQESKLDQLLVLATSEISEPGESLHELVTQLVNVTVDSNRLLKRMEEQLGGRI